MSKRAARNVVITDTDFYVMNGSSGDVHFGYSKYADAERKYSEFLEEGMDLTGITEFIPYWEDLYWCSQYKHTEAYYKEHGKLPPKTSSDAVVRSIGVWVNNQRSRTNRTAKQETLLDAISPDWRNSRDDIWGQTLADVKAFHADHGRLPRHGKNKADEHRLRVWIDSQKTAKTLPAAKRSRLDSELPGWDETNLDRWYEKLQRVSDFCTTHNRTPVVSKIRSAEEQELGHWLKGVRTDFNKNNAGNLNCEQIAALSDKIPGWSASHGDKWNQTLQELKDFIATHNRMPEKSERGTHAYFQKWIQSQREKLGKGLTTEQIAALDAVVPEWSETPDQIWERKLDALAQYVMEHQDFPSDSKGEHKRLGSWYQVQKRELKNGKLGQDRKAALDAKVPHWEDTWTFKLHKTASDFQLNGKIPSSRTAMGLWLKRQRESERDKKLTVEQVEMLDRLIPSWRTPRSLKK